MLGILPKTPQEASKKTRMIAKIPPANNFQNHLTYFEKSWFAFAFFFLAIDDTNYFFRYKFEGLNCSK